MRKRIRCQNSERVWKSPISFFLYPLDQRILRRLAALGVRVIDEKHDDPFLPVFRAHVAGEGFDARERAGLEVCVARGRATLKAFFDGAINAEYGQGGF